MYDIILQNTELSCYAYSGASKAPFSAKSCILPFILRAPYPKLISMHGSILLPSFMLLTKVHDFCLNRPTIMLISNGMKHNTERSSDNGKENTYLNPVTTMAFKIHRPNFRTVDSGATTGD